MSEPREVMKYSANVKLDSKVIPEIQRAGENLTAMLRGLPAALDRALNATPEQRAEWARLHEQREAEEARVRAEERASHDTETLTTEALTAKMGWSREYAEHLVQPYCECGGDIDGWSYCQHAYDLGLAP